MEQGGGEDPTIIPSLSETKETNVLVTDQHATSSSVSMDTTVKNVQGDEADPSIKQSTSVEPEAVPIASHTLEGACDIDGKNENVRSDEVDPVVKHLDTVAQLEGTDIERVDETDESSVRSDIQVAGSSNTAADVTADQSSTVASQNISVDTDALASESSRVCAGDVKEVTQQDGDGLPDVGGGHANTAEQTSVDVRSTAVKHDTDVSAGAGMVGNRDSRDEIEEKDGGLGEQQLRKMGEGEVQVDQVGGMGAGVKESEGELCQEAIQQKSTVSQNQVGDAGHPVNTAAEATASHAGHMTSETVAPQPKQPVTGDFISLGLQKGSSGSPKHEASKKRKKAKKRHSKDKFSPVIGQLPHAFGQPAIGQPSSAGLTQLSSHMTAPQMSHASHMSSEQIQTEILQIDSVLKALNMGMFDESNMATINELTSNEPKPQIKSVGLQLIGQLDSAESSSSDSDDSSSDSSDNSMGVQEEIRDCDSEEEEGKDDKSHRGPRTKGEVDHKSLPPVEDCDIPFPENGQLCPIAKVIHHTESLVILESLPGAPPVDEATVLWSEEQKSLAKVFETFGPVKKPYYSIRVNSPDHVSALGLTAGRVVYIIPGSQEMTKYVFTDKLMSQKGSDASWMEDVEVPAEFQEFSDDEAEKNSRVKKRENGKKRKQRLHPSHPPHGSHPDRVTTYHQNHPSATPFFAPPHHRQPPMIPPGRGGIPHQRHYPPHFMEPMHPRQRQLEDYPPAFPYQQHIYEPPEGLSAYYLSPQAEAHPSGIPSYLVYPPYPPSYPPSLPPSYLPPHPPQHPPSLPPSHLPPFSGEKPPYH